MTTHTDRAEVQSLRERIADLEASHDELTALVQDLADILGARSVQYEDTAVYEIPGQPDSNLAAEVARLGTALSAAVSSRRAESMSLRAEVQSRGHGQADTGHADTASGHGHSGHADRRTAAMAAMADGATVAEAARLSGASERSCRRWRAAA